VSPVVVATISVADTIAAPWSWELTARENPAYTATNQSCYLIGGSLGAMSLPDLKVWSHEGAPDWSSPIASKTLIANAGDPLAIQATNFAKVIRGEEAPVVSGAEGLRSLQVVEAVQQASDTGQLRQVSPLGDNS